MFGNSVGMQLNEDIALNLSRAPLHCIPTEFPNKTSHLADAKEDAQLLPSELHPVFYGCLDWHSAVHGHWMLVRLLQTYPNIENKDSIIKVLDNSFQLKKMQLEAEYFGKSTVLGIVEKGCNVIGFGEMGIGNTSSSSLILSALYKLPIEEVVGRGTGLDDVQFQHKIQVLKQVLLKHEGTYTSGEDILRIFGGFEIVQMYSAMRETARHHMVLLVDGYIATAAFCVAYAEDKSLMDKAIFCHQSDEFAHSGILKKLKVKPLLNLGLRLGEGTGCALAFPLIESAIRFLNEMHTFQDAKVSEKI